MKDKVFAIVLITLTVLITPSIALAYTQVLGVKDTASGQTKKHEVDVDVGRVNDVKPGKVEIEHKGKKIEVKTGQGTSIIEKPSGKKLTPFQLKKDDRIATFANPNATGSANLILVKPKSATESAKPETRRRAVYGLVREINGNILVVSHPIKDNPRYNVEVVEGTIIKIKGLEAATIGNIKAGDRVTAVGNWSGDNLIAKKVHVIGGRAIGLLERIATGSATPSASLSPSPFSSPEISPTP
ncbi:hypothetical protein A2697_02670 [Candidatus Curtissbacteria bacterium RIFCSPHIGHO2_01_FULL_41_44]|uniref:DUF5666 domain-containing protein n=1 Tax=Candidatus Curtissbacteria bacterium RIFCSPLOWO2_01_FULL_42_50 TaxID=1797730 RepID=A0A1F5H864_9BACT|nr:MAG: hypothetical protein A2697_02670 [Candidatus Curtissbacteria bacterium RIFCSPHIGHO2_01_FULL_41_44]OGD92472.1 MAG: hypothetical protein A3C33_04760 [Candidatus Curtissbacteria bacterium RIFCSPHIGHO2_02_FULL_42_58]OGD96265.1 MAG: hypothetical protein A3E71_02255 [Candidatus Curtissbacteria bacterium RIFCSPHIGHO2_12_FULL_42_33]OGE00354.1 MAG: hypothetical protein A3B54_01435 [Candidatus Curtissbacteria bacterium RIFCSPLOWO2_01_FULL_42_50]OGE03817.1 MAG: hypothetical protein A3G16_05075 [Ca